MEHVAWKGHIKPGYKQEYIRRHNEIWPEMVDALKAAGVCNYTIFACGDELFGYYECVHGAAFAQKAQDERPVVARWCEMMSDIQVLSTEADTLEQVFRLD